MINLAFPINYTYRDQNEQNSEQDSQTGFHYTITMHQTHPKRN